MTWGIFVYNAENIKILDEVMQGAKSFKWAPIYEQIKCIIPKVLFVLN